MTNLWLTNDLIWLLYIMFCSTSTTTTAQHVMEMPAVGQQSNRMPNIKYLNKKVTVSLHT